MKINRLIDTYYWAEMEEVINTFFNALSVNEEIKAPEEPLSERTVGHFCYSVLDECFKYYISTLANQHYSGTYSNFNAPMIRHKKQIFEIFKKDDYSYIINYLQNKLPASQRIAQLNTNKTEKNINILWNEYVKEYSDLSTRYRGMDVCRNSSY